jgi:hypothetical protein
VGLGNRNDAFERRVVGIGSHGEDCV